VIDCDYEATTANVTAYAGADAQLHRLREAMPVPVATTNRKSELLLYPNPAGNALFLRDVEAGTMASIYSTDGRLVKCLQTMQNGAVDVSDIATGLYFIKVNAATGRFLKQ
jgi:hypothetical protein